MTVGPELSTLTCTGAVHHIALKSSHPGRLSQFYRNALGLLEITRHRDDQGLRSVWLQLDQAILMIERSEARDVPRTLSVDPPGLHMLAYRIRSEERDAWVQKLQSYQCIVQRETAYTLYFADPEGHLFGLSHWPEHHVCKRTV